MAASFLLCDVLARHARERPDAEALRAWGADRAPGCGYAELAERVDHAAARLAHGLRVGAGDRVAYLGLNRVDEVVLLFALARLGAILVPLNFRLAPPEWQAVLRDARPAALLHDADWADAARALGGDAGIATLALEALAAAGGRPPPAGPPCGEPEAPVLLVYTSGTTGRPKGALHTQANLLANMAAAAAVQGMTPRDRVATVLPLFHVGGLCIQTLPALFSGASVLLHARFDADATLACLAQDRPTLTLQVPATMKALIEHPRWAAADLSSLRAVWAGSSVLPGALVQAFLDRGVPLCNVYGATETGPFSVALPPAQAASHAGSCGWPAPGVALRLDQPRQGVGEVLLRGPAVAARYWPDLPALDGEGWFHTGDLGQCGADGALTIVGRAKDMIISGGENIYPAEIESALADHPWVAECAVLGQPDAQWGEIPVAVVALHAAAPADGWEAALAGHLAPRLARYKQPRRWLRVAALPKTALGKVQKAALQQSLFQPPP